MPKIKPETKMLIIKNLKSKSPAEVADIFNVSKRQVERIRKRYQETGDVHDRPRSGRLNKTTARDDSLLVQCPVCLPQLLLDGTDGRNASVTCPSPDNIWETGWLFATIPKEHLIMDHPPLTMSLWLVLLYMCCLPHTDGSLLHRKH
ncbi:hypothetical protein AAFF_G00068370 [Aldrovandia affinis]|uniref:Uncharacterized protein n=1 Tax=Aldrovandia affinis TaxID=143900 RepID=A0AAD7RZF9_9TELE|nr:hypothetical protein AAFF_G00068370 [Aldrovandia affinis]